MKTLVLIEGDTAPVLVVPIINAADNTPFDLSGKTIVFRMVSAVNETNVVVDDEAMSTAVVWCPEIRQDVTAAVYTWGSGDTDTPGNFKGRVKVTEGSNIWTFPSDQNEDYIPITIRPAYG